MRTPRALSKREAYEVAVGLAAGNAGLVGVPTGAGELWTGGVGAAEGCAGAGGVAGAAPLGAGAVAGVDPWDAASCAACSEGSWNLLLGSSL